MVLSEEQVRKEPGGRQDGCSLNSGYACATATRQGGKRSHQEPPGAPPGSHLDAPDEGAVEKLGANLPHRPQVPHVPDVEAVVPVDAGEPAPGGVVGKGHRVGIERVGTPAGGFGGSRGSRGTPRAQLRRGFGAVPAATPAL